MTAFAGLSAFGKKPDTDCTTITPRVQQVAATNDWRLIATILVSIPLT